MTYIASRYADLFQMSYITRDLDAAVAHAGSALGVDGFRLSEGPVEVLSGGTRQTLVVRAAIANLGRRQFELIEPVSGPVHHYENVLGPGSGLINFHHVAIAVPGPWSEWERLVAEVQASGDEIAFIHPPQAPDSPMPEPPMPEPPMVAFCYVDTRARWGHYTEFLWWHETLNGKGAFPDLSA